MPITSVSLWQCTLSFSSLQNIGSSRGLVEDFFVFFALFSLCSTSLNIRSFVDGLEKERWVVKGVRVECTVSMGTRSRVELKKSGDWMDLVEWCVCMLLVCRLRETVDWVFRRGRLRMYLCVCVCMNRQVVIYLSMSTDGISHVRKVS